MEQKINMPKFQIIEERIETIKPVIIPNLIVAFHSIISLRNTSAIYLVDILRIAALQQKLDIVVVNDVIRYREGHLAAAIEFIEYSHLKN